MFPADDSPERVTATPAATERLTALAAERGGVAVLLSDNSTQLLSPDDSLPSGAVQLGRLDESITVLGSPDAHTAWWCNRAVIDLRPTDSGQPPILTFDLAPLDEDELFAALAAGPLPRY